MEKMQEQRPAAPAAVSAAAIGRDAREVAGQRRKRGSKGATASRGEAAVAAVSGSTERDVDTRMKREDKEGRINVKQGQENGRIGAAAAKKHIDDRPHSFTRSNGSDNGRVAYSRSSGNVKDNIHIRKMVKKEKTTKKNGGEGATASKEENSQSKRFQTLLKVENPLELPDELLSDEDEEENRVGNIPLWWYDALDHIGYDQEGKPLQKKGQFSTIEKLLAKSENEEGWRTVYDVKNRRTVRLTDTDLEIIRRVQSGSFPLSSFKQDEFQVDSDLEDSIFPMHNKPEPKRRFLPSQHEQRKITRIISLIRSGQYYKQQKDKEEEESKGQEDDIPVYDLWKTDIYMRHTPAAVRGLPALPAPKLQLPGHAESYNPPQEFLFTPEEEREWKEMESAQRPLSFLPRRFAALRHVGAFQNLLLERFNRCLDLYLCPRAMKLRMNIDPASLLPALPPLRELRPFPTAIRIDYLPASGYAQSQILPRPLYTLPSFSSSFVSSSASMSTRLSLLKHFSDDSLNEGRRKEKNETVKKQGQEEEQEEENKDIKKKNTEGKKEGKFLNKDREEGEEDELLLQRLLLSEGILCLSIDPSGKWLAVGEKVSTSPDDDEEKTEKAGQERKDENKEEKEGENRRRMPCLGRLWIFEISSGKAFLCFELQQQVTAIAFHPHLPLLAVAVEEQLLLLVLDLPIFETSKLMQLTSLSVDRHSEKEMLLSSAENKKKKKKTGYSVLRDTSSLHSREKLSGQNDKEDEEEKEEEEVNGRVEEEQDENEDEMYGGKKTRKDDKRRMLIEEAIALLRPVEFSDACGDAMQQQENDDDDEEEKEEKQKKFMNHEEKEKEEMNRRKQQERNSRGIWQQIRVKGMAGAPVAAGALGKEKRFHMPLLQQQQQKIELNGKENDNNNKKKKKREKEETKAGVNREGSTSSGGRTTLSRNKVKEEKKEEKEEEEKNENSSFSPALVSAPLGGLLCGVSILHDSPVRCLSWHHKGGYLVAVCPGSVSPTQQCSIHSLRKKKTIHPLRKAPGGRMRAAAFHPTKPWLVLAYQKTIRIFNLQRAAKANDEDDEPSTRKLIGADSTCCLDIHRKGMQIVAGGDNRNVYIFDLDLSSRVYKTFQNHIGAVSAVALHPLYPLLFTASHDG